MQKTFGGVQITRPGSYSQVDTSAMQVVATGSFKSLAFVGEVATLKAGTDTSKLLTFNSLTTKDAKDVLGDGKMLKHVQTAWKFGADLVYISVVQTATPGTPTDAEWQTAIDRLEKSFVDGIVPISTAGAIIAKVDTHIDTMSGILNRRERRGFYGHASGTNVAGIQTLVASAQTERANWATPAPYDYDASGNKVLFDSTLLAAAYAGMWAGKQTQDPITYDYVNFPGFEVEYSQSDISTLLAAGVTPIEVTRQGFRIVQGVTGYIGDDQSSTELSVSTLKDVMSIDMREYMEGKYVGKAGVDGIETTIYNDAVSRIKRVYKEENQWITDYVQDSIKVIKDGTSFSIDWEGKPTLPINNFFITSHFTL